MQRKKNLLATGQKKNWFQGLQSEFKKIVWGQTAITLVKQTIAVVAITVVLAVIISIMDSAILECVNLFNQIRTTVIVCQKQNGTLSIPIPVMRTK